MAETTAGGAAKGCGTGLADAFVTAPHFGQNGAVTGVPQVLQNLAMLAGGFGGTADFWGGGAAVCDCAPHLLQNTPLTGDPHLLQKFAMDSPSSCGLTGL
jgi:hypothetical protein